jgi:hypothetical protein
MKPVRPSLPAPRLLLATLCLLAGAAAAQPAAAPDELQRRLQSVATLIESSSAARQIDSSGDAAARERRDNARLMHREASALLGRGDTGGAARMLDQATREMFSGARLAKPEQVVGEKARRDFDARLESTRALLGAQQRISGEKAGGQAQPEADAATRRIQQQLAEAERLAAAGQLQDARAPLERAYLMARVSIEALRRGDTLVRSLTFASPREEYDYELDRNQTHSLLIQVLQADRRDSAALMNGFVERAASLREQAEARARAGQYAEAIQGLEASTRELLRAIRAGGLYVPG